MYRIISISFLIFLSLNLNAQHLNGCDGKRYINEVFTDDEVSIETIKYGENYNAQGSLQELYMDVYTPDMDVTDHRPLIIWVFGGAYVSGEREDMADYCALYSRLGYVSATIDYRLWDLSAGIPDSTEAMNVAVMSMGDLKAAIRYFRHNYDAGNDFGIDPDKIFVGGLSAGSITTIHAGVIDEGEEIAPFFQELIDLNGGLEGNTGDLEAFAYSSDFAAILNLSGAVYDTNWIDMNDPPIMSFHGTADNVVKYEYGYANVFGFDIIQLHGSASIQTRQDNLGKDGFLVPAVGADHFSAYLNAAYEDERNAYLLQSSLYLYDLICEGIPLSQEAISPSTGINIYPNPASHFIRVEISESSIPVHIQIVDGFGRRVLSQHVFQTNSFELDIHDLPLGSYLVHLNNISGEYLITERFIKLSTNN